MIFEKIKKIIAEKFEFEKDDINKYTRIEEDLEADSLDMADLISTLEGEFKIKIDLKDVRDFKTIKDIGNYIESKIS